MIDALQQVMNQLEQLPADAQAQLAQEVEFLLDEYHRRQAERARVSRMSQDEFAAFLAERQVSKPYLAPGYRGTFYSIEEFNEALESWSGPEAVELYRRDKQESDANI